MSIRGELGPTLRLAAPIVAGQVGQSLMGVIDAVMIGRLGAAPLAASALVHNVQIVLVIAGIGFLTPVAVLAGQAEGGRRRDEAWRVVQGGQVMGAAVGIFLALVTLLLEPLLERLGQPAEVVALSRGYYFWMALSLPSVLLFHVWRQFFEAVGRPFVPLWIILGGLALNVLLNYGLIYGRFGLPRLELAGAGLATFLARGAALLALVIFALRAQSLAEHRPGSGWRRLGPDLRRRLTRLGLPAAAQTTFEVTAFSVAGIMMGWLGTVPLAAHQIVLSCAAFTFMFPLGLSFAASVRVSQVSGAGERARLNPVGWAAIVLGAAVMAGFALLMAVLGPVIPRWFVSDPAVIAVGAQLLVVAAVFQLFDGVQVVSIGALRGLQDVKAPTAITFVAYWVFALPAGYLLAFKAGWGPVGIWVALALGLGTAAALLCWRYHRHTRAGGEAGPPLVRAEVGG